MGETIVPVEINETEKMPDLKARALANRRRYNNFFAALRQGGNTITVANYEINKDYPEFSEVDKPSNRDYELSRLIKEEMDSHNISASEAGLSESLLRRAAMGEKLSENEEAELTEFMDVVEDMFNNVTQKEFEGEQFTAEELRK